MSTNFLLYILYRPGQGICRTYKIDTACFSRMENLSAASLVNLCVCKLMVFERCACAFEILIDHNGPVPMTTCFGQSFDPVHH
jgi:hypothetical protein